MSGMTATESTPPLGRIALATGVLALVLFLGGGMIFDGAFWLIGAVVGVAAIVVGVAARRQGAGREAIAAVILGAIPALWFAAYIVAAAID
jgi:hypothetical protein